MAKELDLLFGVICSDCSKLITVYVRGTPKNATAKVIHGGKVCEPAPLRTPVVSDARVEELNRKVCEHGNLRDRCPNIKCRTK